LSKEKAPEISYLKGVGPKRAQAFEKLGLTRIKELLFVYPREHIYNVKIGNIWKEPAKYWDKNVLISGEVVEKQPPRKQTHPMKIEVSDGTGIVIILIWGNFFYREKQFRIGEKYLFWGKIGYNPYERETKFDYRDHKKYEFGDDEMLKYPKIPLYILSGELRKTWVKPLTLTKIIFNAIRKCSDEIDEVLTDEIKNKNKLLDHKNAILRLHYPTREISEEEARVTLAFEELFYLQLIMALRKKSIESVEKGISFEKTGERLEKLYKELLGFELTDAQKKVIKEIRADMKSCLLQSKTVISALLCVLRKF
jgi:ATP-dependent DNA helicase RecG